MVLIAASIFTKSGKRMIGRCFVDDVTRARLEGLLDAFPKLIGNDKSTQRQHTFIETDSVRYVFHPLDNVYVVLVTTKNSNILEDLETLRLFSRVIPEYCRTIDEKEIINNCFNLIHAFDEIVTLGYRESVNLAQIRTFTEMDSHEERVFMQIKEAQEKAAKDAMAEKAKELKRQQREALTRGLKIGGSGFSSASSATGISSSSTPLTAVQEPVMTKPAASRAIGSGNAMKLGTKTRNEDEFLSQLAKEGQAIAPVERTPRDSGAGAAATTAPVSNVKREPVHIKCEEKFSASVSRDGALQSGELFGTASLCVSSAEFNTVSIQMSNEAPEGVTIQTHPNLEKKDWMTSSLVKLKSANKPFPVNNDVGVLKWRMTLGGEEQLPLALNCWPQENPDGCQVNIEYTLQREDLALENVSIIVPLPPSTAPVVSECEGSYEYLRPRNQLVWTLPSIDSSNATGTLEFSVPNGHADHFFPVHVHFHSESLFAKLVVLGAQTMDTATPVVYSTESRLLTDKYEIV